MKGLSSIEKLSRDWVKQYYDVLVSLLGLLVFCIGVLGNNLAMFIGGMVLIAIGIFIAIAFRIIFRY